MNIPSTNVAAQTTGQTSAFSQLTNNFDTFLTLLTTQLQNQDPLDPLDTENFTEQLVQFASVEQSIQTNTHLQALIDLQSSSDRESAVSLIDRTITTNSDTINAQRGTWAVELDGTASTASYVVVDASGDVVANLTGPTTQGTHLITWDGLDNNRRPSPEGAYRLVVNATSGDGSAVSTNVFARAIVEGASFTDDRPTLETTAGSIALTNVRRVSGSGK